MATVIEDVAVAVSRRTAHGARLEVVSWRSRWSAAHGLRSKRKALLQIVSIVLLWETGTFQVDHEHASRKIPIEDGGYTLRPLQ